MATVRQKRSGVWEVRVFTGNDSKGRPTQSSRTVHGSRRTAQRVANEMEASAGRAAPAGRTVADVLDAWIDQNALIWAPGSRRDYESRVRAIKTDPVARISLARLTVADVEQWHARVRRQGSQDPTIRNHHIALRAALAQAARWGWIATNPASLARLRSTKVEPRRAMTIADVRAVIAAAAAVDPAAELALRLAAVSGARRGELAALQWSDLADRLLTIDSAVHVVRTGDGQPTLHDAATKTANIRTLALDDDTLAMIERLQVERGPYGPWMLGLGPELVSPDRVGWWWKRARELSGIDVRWRLHDLRHWSATVAIGQGHDVRTVAGRLGHANPAMTLRVYAHAFSSADVAVAVSLGEILKRPPTSDETR